MLHIDVSARGAAAKFALALLALPLSACSSDDSGENAEKSRDAGADGAGIGGSSNGGSGGQSQSKAGASSSGGARSGSGGGPASGSGGRTNRGGANSAGQNTASGGGGACDPLGSACDPATTACCGGLVCVTSTSADYAGCREPCEVADDCASGCCIPFANLPDKGFCGAPELCECSGLDGPCGGTRQCCTGFTCTTFDDTNELGCRPLCKTNEDCDTDCCIAIPTTPDSACFMPSWCGK